MSCWTAAAASVWSAGASKTGELKFVPESYSKTYLHWLENIRQPKYTYDRKWNLSRSDLCRRRGNPPSANIDRVKQELTEYELIPEDWGGSTICVPVSAHTGEGIKELLEMVLLTENEIYCE